MIREKFAREDLPSLPLTYYLRAFPLIEARKRRRVNSSVMSGIRRPNKQDNYLHAFRGKRRRVISVSRIKSRPDLIELNLNLVLPRSNSNLISTSCKSKTQTRALELELEGKQQQLKLKRLKLKHLKLEHEQLDLECKQLQLQNEQLKLELECLNK
ncbi:unnamed protein product [Coffea canephora]|uniref:Uncharacterized protein n=1 Tax=Coffea canephora TaxID=49390 RepID=A0A068TZD7_COFCA|nr:unnamed protein product [Coffea canephora]